MKKNLRNSIALTVTLIIGLTAVCLAQPVPAPAVLTSVSKTSFNEVTAQLDPGGNFYLYLGTAQWLEQLSAKVETWRKTFTSFPDAKPEDVENINKAFDLVGHLITDSGIETVSGVGISSVEIEKGMYRNKFLLHHFPGKDGGFLWKFGGGAPHPLTGLDLLPANTAFAIFADMDLPLMWETARAEAAKSGFPQANDFLKQLPTEFEKSTKLNWDTFLHSLGGEFGIAITLNESNNIPIPLPQGAIMIPEPGILIAVRVTDDTVFNRIAEELKKNQQVVNVDKTGLKMRTLPVPLPFAINLRPTAASSGGYLFISSADELVNQSLAVKAGDQPGLKSTAEFKQLALGLPAQGNQFSFISAKFGQTMMKIQKQTLAGANGHTTSAAQAAWLESFFRADRASFSYSVGMNTPDGSLTIGNGNQSAAALMLLPVAVVPGVLAAVAIPNFVKARSTSQMNVCINNLRQMDAAKNQWALEKNKKAEDVPTEDDIKPYIKLMNGELPKCPQGGSYTLGPLSESPKCSIPGHTLP